MARSPLAEPQGAARREVRETVLEIYHLYTRVLGSHERVLCLDEKTSLQPRTRAARTRPAQPGLVPVRLEHEYQRKGALHLFASFDTRTGEVIGLCRRRKRQAEFIDLLEKIDRHTPGKITLIHLVCDNSSVHHGKRVRAWLAGHPRFRMQFTPVHCSWMNQVEQWFSLFQRKRLAAPDFADLAALEERVLAFIQQWNDEEAHPFNWTTASFARVLAKASPVVRNYRPLLKETTQVVVLARFVPARSRSSELTAHRQATSRKTTSLQPHLLNITWACVDRSRAANRACGTAA